MKKKPNEEAPPTVEPEYPHGFLAAATTIDPEGLTADIGFLAKNGWVVSGKSSDMQQVHRVEWVKGESINLAAGMAETNNHRLAWELTVRVNSAQIGYATKTLRPGDLTAGILHTLIREAVDLGETEVNRWKDALADARRHLGI